MVQIDMVFKLFAILQKYDFSSKSQPMEKRWNKIAGCLRYCKSTIFQANHNTARKVSIYLLVVCDTAKVRFFKQITTAERHTILAAGLFAILQKYDFSSKSQLSPLNGGLLIVVCDTAKVRFFKQITTNTTKLDKCYCCLRYCKSTIFQANHNR